MTLRRRTIALLTAAGLAALTACTGAATPDAPTGPGAGATSGAGSPAAQSAQPATSGAAAPAGEPVYAQTTGPDKIQGAMKQAKPLIYVPYQLASMVDVIDPATMKVIRSFPVATSAEHVVPSPDGSKLYVNSDKGNALTPIDPVTGEPGKKIDVEDPYNLYFTPDGKYALVMAERLRRIDVRDATTMQLVRSLPVPCVGINHADFSADLQTMVSSCEFDGKLIVTDANATEVKKVINLNGTETPGATPPSHAKRMGAPKSYLLPGASAMPQDVRLSPDGKRFLVADMLRNGIWWINARTLEYEGFTQTGLGAHAIYPSRDTKSLYIANRDGGSVSVLDSATLAVTATWAIPGGGSPDMGGVTADGSQLWLTGRYHAAIYVFDTSTGGLKAKIPARPGPHGLLVWPQPGRFSLGHTGNMR